VIETISVLSPNVLQTGDLHLSSRELDDQEPVLQEITQLLKNPAREIGVVVVAGDLSGTACPHLARPSERLALLRFLVACRRHGAICIVLRGNHDVADDWRWLNEVEGIRFVDRPMTFILDGGAAGKATLHCLPYPDRSWVAAAAGKSAAEVTALMQQHLETIIRGFAVVEPEIQSRLVVGHLNTRGAKASTGQPIIGSDVEVPATLLDESGASLCLLNHIHLPQQASNARCPVIHVGSPWPTNYGETEQKRVAVVTPEGPDWCFASIPTDPVQRLTRGLRWDVESRSWVPKDPDIATPVLTDKTRVRLQLHYDEGDDIDLTAAERLGHGALAVKLERVMKPRERVRAPEVVRASTMTDRFVAFEGSEGRDVDEALLGLFEDLAGGAT
jgi:FAD/FMN-containing dehydrogenase